MKKDYNELTKFKILTDIKDNPVLYTGMTIPEIAQHLIKKFDTAVSTTCLYRWAKIYNFSYKPHRKPPVPKQSEVIKQTNHRIRILGIVIHNMCKELNLKSPSMLDKLLDGITTQYGDSFTTDSFVKVLEEQIYDKI